MLSIATVRDSKVGALERYREALEGVTRGKSLSVVSIVILRLVSMIDLASSATLTTNHVWSTYLYTPHPHTPLHTHTHTHTHGYTPPPTHTHTHGYTTPTHPHTHTHTHTHTQAQPSLPGGLSCGFLPEFTTLILATASLVADPCADVVVGGNIPVNVIGGMSPQGAFWVRVLPDQLQIKDLILQNISNSMQ